MHQQAREIAPKVKYEWKMFESLAEEITKEYRAAPQWKKNLLMEAFLLHARVLLDFFVRKPLGDDVSARHFFDDDSKWASESSSLCQYLQTHRTRLNKKLPPLTYSRLTENERWDFETIHKEVSHAWNKFHSLLPKSVRKWFT